MLELDVRPADTIADVPTVELRALERRDWPAVADIYWDGMRSGLATFETEVPSWEAWDAGHLPDHRLVADLLGEIVGWAALSPVSSRRCYAGVVENSVYVAGRARGQGVGRRLLEALIDSTEADGIWTIQAGMFPENQASIRLHESVGFEPVGLHKRLGKLDGEWRDVLLLERRSPVVD